MGFDQDAAEKSQRSVIVFNDLPGPGYILVRALNNGSEREVYLVRSEVSGEEYVLKDTSKNSEILKLQTTAQRLSFNNVFPPGSNMVPTATRCATRPSSVLYQVCNGGNLSQFLLEKLGLNSNPMLSEAFMWYMIKEICKILAFTLNGIVNAQPEPAQWNAIVNTDLSSLNQFFAHWPEDSEVEFPVIMIGDWGFGKTYRNPPENIRNALAQVEFNGFNNILDTLKSTFYREELRKDDFRAADSPFSILQNIYQDAIALSNSIPRIPGFHMAKYITQKFIPVAEGMIVKLQTADRFDLRLSDPTEQYVGYTENEQGEWWRENMIMGKLVWQRLERSPFKRREESILIFGDNGDKETDLKNGLIALSGTLHPETQKETSLRLGHGLPKRMFHMRSGQS